MVQQEMDKDMKQKQESERKRGKKTRKYGCKELKIMV